MMNVCLMALQGNANYRVKILTLMGPSLLTTIRAADSFSQTQDL